VAGTDFKFIFSKCNALRLNAMMTTSLPKYDNPPLEEVAFGVSFDPLHRFKTPYIGLFWDRIRKDFPNCEQAPVIGNIEDIIEPQVGLPTPRVWLINSADDHLVQIQKNKFLFNWRKRKDFYPSFELVRTGFFENFNNFLDFVLEHDLGDLNVRGYELTYINIILPGKAWGSLNNIYSLFPDLSWRSSVNRFLKDVDNLLWQTGFVLPDDYGNLVIQLQKGIRKTDNSPLLRLELTVRGFNEDTSPEGVKKWFGKAHEWIVLSFEDITDEHVQKEVWKKHARHSN
jgi:uncharacterized protein (TIGR04255 family)